MDLDVVNIETFIQGQRDYNKYDPRSDLKEDHDYWKLVLKEADKIDHKLYCILHGYRCVGTRLKKDEGILKLKRGIEWEDYWPDNEAYKKDNYRYLLSYRYLIKDILKRALQDYEQLALF